MRIAELSVVACKKSMLKSCTVLTGRAIIVGLFRPDFGF